LKNYNILREKDHFKPFNGTISINNEWKSKFSKRNNNQEWYSRLIVKSFYIEWKSCYWSDWFKKTYLKDKFLKIDLIKEKLAKQLNRFI
jgi:hypothetical protein